ncbi:MAG: type II toxin-antitoxin system PemK/MazF family toxin [Burkholderiales bacterium]|nr:type II toxin-antitoxin system PemK/MazF family toxin [Burkholderiales bacterium]
MGAPAAGTIVLVPFPFSDLSQAKLRPALVLAHASHEDIILAQITSRSYADANAVEVAEQDFLFGTLSVTSFVRPSKLFTAHQSLVKAEIGKLKPHIFIAIIKRVTAIFNANAGV